MAAEQGLRQLIRHMRPEAHPGRYVFAAVPGPVPPGLPPVVTVAEDEGLTVVVPCSSGMSGWRRRSMRWAP